MKNYVWSKMLQQPTPTRKAILIGVPGPKKDHLRGVFRDIEAVQAFLLSGNGGKWRKNEIVVLANAKLDDVISEVHSCVADYCFVFYAGHGFEERKGKRKIVLVDCEIRDEMLLNKCPRQLLIFDTCRKIVPAAIGAVPEEDFFPFDGYYPEREAFDKFVLQSPPGKLIVHSTKSNQYAEECSSGAGGYFTQNLLRSAGTIRRTELYASISVKNAVLQTRISLRNSGVFQEPEIAYSVGELRVPFAIFCGQNDTRVSNVKKWHPQRRQMQPNNYYSGITVAGILLLAMAAIAD